MAVRNKIDKEAVFNLFSKGKTAADVAKELGYPSSTMRVYRSKWEGDVLERAKNISSIKTEEITLAEDERISDDNFAVKSDKEEVTSKISDVLVTKDERKSDKSWLILINIGLMKIYSISSVFSVLIQMHDIHFVAFCVAIVVVFAPLIMLIQNVNNSLRIYAILIMLIVFAIQVLFSAINFNMKVSNEFIASVSQVTSLQKSNFVLTMAFLMPILELLFEIVYLKIKYPNDDNYHS
ncbi:hypothetical protein [Arcicella rosea]|uniref:Uncharacterized protein n=1 Tax=Arcicella rosea TaxID=502909 RepID=A0A841EL19_9BACT|nr:hypothetical protein [Arcicella rosea]MBB6003895.1 hypothetical protein [Arcicella rosea]